MAQPPDELRPDLVPLIDLSPEDADAVCDAMANVGLEAVPYRLDPGASEGAIEKAQVRLYVPRNQVRDARAVVRGVLPEYGATADERPETLPDSEEQAWAQIVAELRAEGFEEPQLPPTSAPPPAGSSSAGETPTGIGAPEHFQPPAPGPLPRIRRPLMVGWLGIALGTVVAVLGTVLYGGGVPQLLGVAIALAGFVGLVMSLHERDSDDDDDGAVV